MKIKTVLSFFLFIFPLLSIATEQFFTVPELTSFQKTSLANDVREFILRLSKKSPLIKISTLGYSAEGQQIPLVIISREGICTPKDKILHNKPCILFMANIHAGEVEGKEAVQMVMREIVFNDLDRFLEHQILLIIPNFNIDSNDKLGKNRRDNGPELAGLRSNSQNLDLNRDYLKMESPEIKSLIELFNQWDPILTVDLHTTNGSYHQEPVTYLTVGEPNADRTLHDYMWQQLFPAVSKQLKDTYGYDSIPYGNFVDRADPSKGWQTDSFDPMMGSNYVGLRNRFTILSENYAYADFKTRVLSCLGFIKAILEYSHHHIRQMQTMAFEADKRTINHFSQANYTLEFTNEKLFDFEIKSYVLKKEPILPHERHQHPPWVKDFIIKNTQIKKNYTIPYFNLPKTTRSIPLPNAYIIPYSFKDSVIALLQLHGITISQLVKPLDLKVERFTITELIPDKMLFQGHFLLKFKGHYQPEIKTIPENSFFVSLKQPLARLIPVLLEPESSFSLPQWGLLNRVIMQQWTNIPNEFPIQRFTGPMDELELIQLK
jgi:hypothetical protein